MSPKDADEMANTCSVDPDQTAPSDCSQSDLALHCLPRPIIRSENLGSFRRDLVMK